MKALIFLLFLSPLITNFNCSKKITQPVAPWQPHAWACEPSRDQPYEIYRWQKNGGWILGWSDHSSNPINWGTNVWSQQSDLPVLHEDFVIAGENWFIIDIPLVPGTQTSKTCTSACAAYCQLGDGHFTGIIIPPGTGLRHCSCNYR